MKIKSLHLKNIFCFEDITVNFSELDFALFIGNNGQGKSAIFDGLCWVLFDRTARPKYHQNKVVRDIPTKQKQAEGIVKIDVDGKEVVITRNRGKINNVEISTKPELRTQTMVDEEIVKEIGMDYKTFMNIAYFSQGDIGKFLVSDSNERIRILSDILGLDLFDKAVDGCNKELKLIEGDVISAKSKIDVYASENEEINIEQVNKEVKKNKSLLIKIIDDISAMSHNISAMEKKMSLKKELNQYKNNYNSVKEDGKNILLEYDKKISGYEDQISVVDTKKLKSDLEHISKYEEEKKLMEERMETLQDEKDSILKKKSDLLSKYEVIKSKIKELESVLEMEGKECPTCHSLVNKSNINKIATRIAEYEEKRKNVANSVECVNEDEEHNFNAILKLKKEINIVSDNIKDRSVIKEKLANVKSYEVFLSNSKNEKENYKERLKNRLAKIKNEYNVIKDELENYNDISIDQYEVYNERMNDLLVEKEDLQKAINIAKHKSEKYHANLKMIKNYKLALEEHQVEYDDKQYLKQAFPKIKISMIAEAVPFIQSQTNKYLSEIFSGRRIMFDVDPNRAQNKFDMVIEDYEYNVKRVFEGWSGGQQDRMGLAVYLALNKLASLKSGKSVDFLILDEKFAKIDEQSRFSILELLKNEYEDRSIYCISHVNMIQSEFKHIVKVEMENGISDITVTRNNSYE